MLLQPEAEAGEHVLAVGSQPEPITMTIAVTPAEDEAVQYTSVLGGAVRVDMVPQAAGEMLRGSYTAVVAPEDDDSTTVNMSGGFNIEATEQMLCNV